MKVFFLIPQQVALHITDLLGIPTQIGEWGSSSVVCLPEGTVDYVGPFPSLMRDKNGRTYLRRCMEAIKEADVIVYPPVVHLDDAVSYQKAYAVGLHKNFMAISSRNEQELWDMAVPVVSTYDGHKYAYKDLEDLKGREEFESYCTRLLAFNFFDPPHIPEVSFTAQNGLCCVCGRECMCVQSLVHPGEITKIGRASCRERV